MPSRRALLQSAAGGLALAVRAPAIVTAGPAIVQVPYGVQVGDVVGDRAMIWAKADRAARMQVRWATTESMADAVERADRGRARGSRLHRQDRRRRAAGGPAHLLRSQFRGSRRPEVPQPAGHRQLRHAAARAARSPLRLVGRHGGAGLGHQPRFRWHADLRGDAFGRARFLHPLRRHDLRRQPDSGRGQAAGRPDLAQSSRSRRSRRSRRRCTSSG